jgi:hypothetical protein
MASAWPADAGGGCRHLAIVESDVPTWSRMDRDLGATGCSPPAPSCVGAQAGAAGGPGAVHNRTYRYVNATLAFGTAFSMMS